MLDVSQKSEKLASALYLITSFFADQEPMKWKLRSLVSDLVSLSSYQSSNSLQENGENLLSLRNIVLEVKSLTFVAKNAGLISEANHALLDSEFNKYISLLNLPIGISEKDGRAIISPDFFISANNSNEEVGKIQTRQPGSNLFLKDKNNSVLESSKSTELLDISDYMSKGQEADKKSYSTSVNDDLDRPRDLKDYGAVSVKKNSRQSVIINILKRKKEIMIKDVSSLISGCSEKTIQRELLAMVKSGVLKKVGEKRWSRYTLA